MKKEQVLAHLSDYVNYIAKCDLAQKTVTAYKTDLVMFARWFLDTNGKMYAPQDITTVDLREYRHYMLNIRQLSANTINRRLASISSYLTWANEAGMIEFNPADRIKGVRTQELAPKWLTKKEEGALLRQAEQKRQAANSDSARLRATRNWSLVVLILTTGLRSAEVCSLTLSQVEIKPRSGSLQIVGKGAKQRTVPLNKRARTALETWLDVRPECGHDTVFVGQTKHPLATASLRRIITDLSYHAKIEDVSPHTLRHTFGKRLVDSGVSLEKVAALMGHANLNTTKIYTTPSQRDLEKAVKVLEY